MGSGKGSTPRSLGPPINLLNRFFLFEYSLYEKSRQWRRGGGTGKECQKLVATNVVASWPPKHQPIGTPTACAKNVVEFVWHTHTPELGKCEIKIFLNGFHPLWLFTKIIFDLDISAVQKVCYCPGTKFWLNNVRTIHLVTLSQLKVMRVNIRVLCVWI